MTLGTKIGLVAPEAAEIIKAELELSDGEFDLFNADDSVPYWGDAQELVQVQVFAQGDEPKDNFREILLGKHSILGPLQARLPEWNSDHCGNGCCQDRAEVFFQNALFAKYGLPQPTGMIDRFNSPQWSAINHGSNGCGTRNLSVFSRHCNFLKQGHAMRQTVTLAEECGGDPAEEFFEQYHLYTGEGEFVDYEGFDGEEELCW